MGGKAKPSHPDYLTRVQAANAIAKALTGNPDDEIVHVAYRRIGDSYRKGELVSDAVAGGRTKQFLKSDLYDFALKTFNVEVDEFKLIKNANIIDEQVDQNKHDEFYEETLQELISNEDDVVESISKESILDDVKSIIRLYDRKLIDTNQATTLLRRMFNREV